MKSSSCTFHQFSLNNIADIARHVSDQDISALVRINKTLAQTKTDLYSKQGQEVGRAWGEVVACCKRAKFALPEPTASSWTPRPAGPAGTTTEAPQPGAAGSVEALRTQAEAVFARFRTLALFRELCRDKEVAEFCRGLPQGLFVPENAAYLKEFYTFCKSIPADIAAVLKLYPKLIPDLDLKGRAGGTHYIDFLAANDLSAPVARGHDRFGRAFVAYRYEKTQQDGNTPRVWVATFFQRHSNADSVWVNAGDHFVDWYVGDVFRDGRVNAAWQQAMSHLFTTGEVEATHQEWGNTARAKLV